MSRSLVACCHPESQSCDEGSVFLGIVPTFLATGLSVMENCPHRAWCSRPRAVQIEGRDEIPLGRGDRAMAESE
ncbi:MAG TPA: hypothetical protein VKX96_02320 [Chloroflexota bacterium]|nr:hypothetical protein [Chloroflexota bacterium]